MAAAAHGGWHDSARMTHEEGHSQALRRKPRRLMTAQGGANDGVIFIFHTAQRTQDKD
jgi:hypothetical protein